MGKTLYLFIDESGNFDFSKNGTKYFVLTALITNNPTKVAIPLVKLRYKLLCNNLSGAFQENGYFHASEDLQVVRDKIFKILTSYKRGLVIDFVALKKGKIKKNKDFETEFYKKIGQKLLNKVFNSNLTNKYSEVCIVFSSLFDKKRRGLLKQIFKSTIKSLFFGTYFLYFHDSKFDYCNQAVDYYGWAVYRRWENSDMRSFNLIKRLVNK